MESEMIAFAILVWEKPMSAALIHCDSIATIVKI